jgi:protein-S-isoprenylcysteine O-methyltransferase Ste14
MNQEVSKVKIISRLVFTFLISGIIIFSTAGTLKWLEAWLYLALAAFSLTFNVVWMMKNDPRLLRDRMLLEKKSPKGLDRILLFFYMLFLIVLFVLPGLDAVRFKWSSLPFFIKVAGLILTLIANYIIFIVLRENPHLSSIVEVHQDREHKVISSGIYRYVRHPWYVGIILWFCGIPLALGSLYSLIPVGMLIILLVIRIFIEEKTLGIELSGYKDYCQKVKYRLLPYVW